jgi:membrane protease YdiL (CAAX protease family)
MLRTRPLLSFVMLAYGLTWTVMAPLLLQARGVFDFGLAEEWEALAAFGPFLAAWIVVRAQPDATWRREFVARLRRWPATARGWWLVAGSPFAFLAAALAFEGWRTGSVPPIAAALSGAIGTAHGFVGLVIIGSVLQSLGEEPGWRGLLLPRLRARFAPLTATFVLFPVWLFWHLPMFLARPDFGLAQFGGFALGILSAAIWLTALHEESDSAAGAVLWHALANTTRGIALAVSTPAFLAYGMAVTLGAIYYAVRGSAGSRRGAAPRPVSTS